MKKSRKIELIIILFLVISIFSIYFDYHYDLGIFLKKPNSIEIENNDDTIDADEFTASILPNAIMSDTSETALSDEEEQVEEIMKNLIVDDFPEKRPEFYILRNGDSIALFEYFKSSSCDFPENLKYYIDVSVDSTGNIHVLRTIKKEGNKPKDFHINDFVKRIIALPAEKNGKKVSFTMTIPLERTKYY